MQKDDTDAELIDATSEPIESTARPLEARGAADPAMSTVVALANELQSIYKNDQSKLETVNRTLRQAIHPKH